MQHIAEVTEAHGHSGVVGAESLFTYLKRPLITILCPGKLRSSLQVTAHLIQEMPGLLQGQPETFRIFR